MSSFGVGFGLCGADMPHQAGLDLDRRDGRAGQAVGHARADRNAHELRTGWPDPVALRSEQALGKLQAESEGQGQRNRRLTEECQCG